MSSTVYDRLTALMQSVGVDGEEGSVQYAEIAAYCSAISLAQNTAEQVLSDVFVDTMGEKGMQMYCDLLNIQAGETAEETKEKIIERLSGGFSAISLDDYRNAEKNVPGLSSEYYTEYETVTINPVSKESLSGLSDFMQNYCPVFFSPEFLGSGITFDSLDSLDYRWYETDRLALSFDIWERIGARED